MPLEANKTIVLAIQNESPYHCERLAEPLLVVMPKATLVYFHSLTLTIFVSELRMCSTSSIIMNRLCTNDSYPSFLQSQLADLRTNKQLCDVDIVVENCCFSAHRCVLAASSEYFSKMFTGRFKESREESVNLEGISKVAFEKIINYVYQGEIHISSENVQEICEAADILQYEYIKGECEVYMLDDIKAENCLDYLLFAIRHSMVVMEVKAMACICQKFDLLANLTQFKNLDMTTVSEILSSDELCCTSEVVVLRAMCGWLECHPEINKEDKDKVLDTLRFGLLNAPELEKIWSFEDILGTDYCIKIVRQMLEFRTAVHMQPLKTGKFFCPRGSKCMVIMGGLQKETPQTFADTVHAVEMNMSKVVFHELGNLPVPRTEAAAVSFGNFAFLIGGKNTKIESSVFRFDVVGRYWLAMSSMKKARYKHSAAILEESILVVGGREEDDDSSKSVERYNIGVNKWTTLHDFPHPVTSAAMCQAKSAVYLSGGHKGYTGRHVTDMVHMYDPKEDSWALKGILNVGRAGHGACINGNTMYIVGGVNDANKCTDIVECFNLDTGQTVILTRIVSLPRRCSLATFHIDTVFAVGGWRWADKIDEESASTDEILMHDIHQDSSFAWHRVDSALPMALDSCTGTTLIIPHTKSQPTQDIMGTRGYSGHL